MDMDFEYYMHLALEEANKAYLLDEVPVGSVVITLDGKIIAKEHNRCITMSDPCAHAEILAIRKAGKYLSNYRLTNCIVVTTLEPCIMCMGSLVNARIEGLVFGCRDLRSGAVYSRLNFFNDINWLNHRFWIKEDILSNKCSKILKDFFKQKRKIKRRGTEVRS